VKLGEVGKALGKKNTPIKRNAGGTAKRNNRNAKGRKATLKEKNRGRSPGVRESTESEEE